MNKTYFEKRQNVLMNLFTWKISPEDMKKQVDEYNSLSVWKSYRGQVLQVLLFVIGVTLLAGTFGILGDPVSALFTGILYGICLFFAYKGHKWAYIVLLVFTILNAVLTMYYSAVISHTSPIAPIFISWVIVCIIIKAMRVEKERERLLNKI